MSTQILELSPTPRLLNFHGTYKIIKAEGRRLIGGYASVEVKDSQGETITLEALKGALGPFMEAKLYRNVHVMHTNIEVGKVLDSVVDSEGYLWETKVDDLGLFVVCEIDRPIKEADRVWDAIQRGDMRDFSIGGEAIHRTGPHGEIIDQLELFEITICFNGANPGGKFVIIKAVPSTEIPACVACKLSKSVEAPTIFTRGTDGKRFIIYPSQVRKDEAGASDAVSVLEQRSSETRKSENQMSKEEGKNAGTPPPSPAPDGAEKIDMQKLLEFDAHLVKLTDLLEQMVAAAQAEKTGGEEQPPPEQPPVPPPAGTSAPAPPPKPETPAAPSTVSLSEETMKLVVQKVKDELVKVIPPEKRTIVPTTGAPGEKSTGVDLDQIAKMGWPELEDYEAQRRANVRERFAIP